MMRRMDRRGYSFIEMLTVIVVMAIMLAITILAIAPSIQGARVRGALNRVAGDLQEARTWSAKRGRPVAIVVNPSTMAYVIRDRDSSSVILHTRELGQDTEYDLDQFSVSPSSVELFPNGVVRATTTFTLGLGTYVREIKLTKAGQIQIVPN